MNSTFSHVPPGFRFHPTDEELVDYYLRKKITSRRIDLDVIKDVDLYKIEPWDLQEICRIGTEEQNEWYFFSHKDKKYPTGTRTNRATAAGFWKATGRDKAIYSKHDLIGMRKTLVFYKGRAPNGQKSDWIMHEYRLETDENGTPQEEGWVVCRVFKKRVTTTMRKVSEHDSPCWYEDQVTFIHDLDSADPNNHSSHSQSNNFLFHQQQHLPYSCKKEFDLPFSLQPRGEHFLQHQHQLPLLESPKLLLHPAPYPPLLPNQPQQPQNQVNNFEPTSILFNNNANNEQVMTTTDWRVLDKFVASQLSQEDALLVSNKDTNNHFSSNNNNNVFHAADNSANLDQQEQEQEQEQEMVPSTSNSTCPIDLWK